MIIKKHNDKSKRNVPMEVFKSILEQELIGLGSGAGSCILYQPKAPASFDMYKVNNGK